MVYFRIWGGRWFTHFYHPRRKFFSHPFEPIWQLGVTSKIDDSYFFLFAFFMKTNNFQVNIILTVNVYALQLQINHSVNMIKLI